MFLLFFGTESDILRMFCWILMFSWHVLSHSVSVICLLAVWHVFLFVLHGFHCTRFFAVFWCVLRFLSAHLHLFSIFIWTHGVCCVPWLFRSTIDCRSDMLLVCRHVEHLFFNWTAVVVNYMLIIVLNLCQVCICLDNQFPCFFQCVTLFSAITFCLSQRVQRLHLIIANLKLHL